MERQELEYKFEQLMRERHKWYYLLQILLMCVIT